MDWYKNIFKKQAPKPIGQKGTEFTEFELSESHRILLHNENIMEELLQHISDQKQLIMQHEEEIQILRYKLGLHTDNRKIIEEESQLVF